jgi:hypothetical protein
MLCNKAYTVCVLPTASPPTPCGTVVLYRDGLGVGDRLGEGRASGFNAGDWRFELLAEPYTRGNYMDKIIPFGSIVVLACSTSSSASFAATVCMPMGDLTSTSFSQKNACLICFKTNSFSSYAVA